MGKNFAMALNENGGIAKGAFVLGVDMAQYRRFFGDNLKLIEGRLLEGNEPGVLVPTGWRKLFGDYYNILFSPEGTKLDTAQLGKGITSRLSELTVKHSAVFMGINNENSTTDVRVPVQGHRQIPVAQYHLGQVPDHGHRILPRVPRLFFRAGRLRLRSKRRTSTLLAKSDESLDNLFTQRIVGRRQKSGAASAALARREPRGSPRYGPPPVDPDAGTWNLVLLRFAPGKPRQDGGSELNKTLCRETSGVRAITWKKATGIIGSMATLIKSSLFVFVMFLFSWRSSSS